MIMTTMLVLHPTSFKLISHHYPGFVSVCMRQLVGGGAALMDKAGNERTRLLSIVCASESLALGFVSSTAFCNTRGDPDGCTLWVFRADSACKAF